MSQRILTGESAGNVLQMPTAAAPEHTGSIYKASYLEALRHKWIASEEAGCDLGEGAVAEWLKHHWKGWCRERWLEHLMGRVRWLEFPAGEFAALKRKFQGSTGILDRVVEKILLGAENLDIIIWASELSLDITQVIDILIVADINRPVIDNPRFFYRQVL